MRRWAISLKITRRDDVLATIDEELAAAGITETGTTGVRLLVDHFRKADAYARGAQRRIYELGESIKEYERAFQRIKAAEQDAVRREQGEATPIEQLARQSSGIDLPLTQRTPVYLPPEGGDARAMPVVSPSADTVTLDRIQGPASGRIAPTELETDKEA